MLAIVITSGITGSGKSYWANRFVGQSQNWMRFSRDDARAFMNGNGGPWAHFKRDTPPEHTEAIEQIVTRMRNAFVLEAMKRGKNVIIDETNNRSRTFKEVCRLLEPAEFEVSISEKIFYVDLDTALARDRARTPNVGDKIVQDFFRKFGGEKFEKAVPKQLVITKRADLPILHTGPKAIVCDLDGTLALFGSKNPYDRDFENDTVNWPVFETIELFSELGDTEIIFVSGRSEKFRAQTEEFFKKNLIDFHSKLFMRKDGDRRPDTIVKYEIYRDSIYGKYDINFILDDRSSVVKLWRDIGLTVFQVNSGDF
jgi:predicted kinase